ncbi:MAG: sensor histidine kinase [Rickettsiales bacterium]
MFSYLRYFALISLLLVIVGSLTLSIYFRQVKERELLELTSAQAVATTASYANTVWARYAGDLLSGRIGAMDPAFTGETQKFFQGQPISKITIFSPDVTRLYYGSTAVNVMSEGIRVGLFDIQSLSQGKATSRLLKDVYFAAGENASEPRVMVQVLVPILHPGTKTPDADVELYVDIGPQWDELQFTQYLIIGIMVGTFAVLITVLTFTASRAEAIIAKQHEVNLELIAAAAQAEAQSRDKSQFLASVSHELRTPLNAIIGFSEIIKAEAKQKLEKVYQDYIEDIYASGKHLLSLINDILDFSKAEAGKLQIEWAETDASKVIRNSLRMVLPRAEAGQITLVEDIPTQHLVIVTDAKKLKQVLLNLLSNAVKFTPAGGEVRCHAWTDVVTHALAIQVKDTGIGIAPKDISRVMTPFGQVDSALSRKYEGTGLGLPLAKKFVESMGGTFIIESELHVGTSVTIMIPKAPPNWGQQPQETAHVASDNTGDQAA